ncbi:MAG: uncharacterized protein PWP15_1318 [Methanothermococcus sp.]|jgi:hypothetical protein|uniref:DUF192 domain-containing protein n=1 Tax=Methanothermococcus TaxID=155862 RepID=UPI00037B0F76|nr:MULTISPECIES: DUF192 domain-containing protein [Methanothermococcus]MDK2790809.1 uncharacterized protein [Methanothermococcus sp.]MDK2988030.1 uncharacterized protein [Methanothermococcus sp.]
MPTIKIGNKVYNIELADNFVKRAFGLMFRNIKDDEGLLFLYKKRKIHIHTYFVKYPLDIIFLMDDEVVDTVKNMKPWKTYRSRVYSNAMLEIKSGNVDIDELLGKKIIIN